MKFKDYQKVVFTILAILIIISFITTCQNRKNRRDIISIKSNTEQLQSKFDNLIMELDSNFYSKEELTVLMKIEGLKVSKRLLYDNNAIIRTTVRPDDKMNEYDIEIELLQEQIK